MATDPKTEFASFCDGIRDPEGKVYKYTDRERLFVFHYLTDAGFVASKAVEMSGYQTSTPSSTRQMATEILRRPKIKAAINNAFDALVMPKTELLHRLSEIARGSVEDLLDDRDEFSMRQARVTGKANLIRKFKIERDVIEVKTEKVDLPEDAEGDAEIFERSIIKERVSFEIHDPLKAIELLGRNFRLFPAGVQNFDAKGEPSDAPPATVIIELPDNGRGDTTHPIRRVRKTVEMNNEDTGNDSSKE